MSAHRIDAIFARRCAVSSATRTKAPNVPPASAAFQTSRISSSAEGALAGLLLGILAAHPPDDRRMIVVVPGRIPVHDRADDRQHAVGLPCAVIVLDVVQQRRDIGALDAEERPPLPEREDVHLQQPGDLLLGAQALPLDVPLQPAPGLGFEGFHRGLERRLPGPDAGDGCPRLLAGLIDAQHIGGTDGRPNLLAGSDRGRPPRTSWPRSAERARSGRAVRGPDRRSVWALP